MECLREIADYMDEIGRKAGVAKVRQYVVLKGDMYRRDVSWKEYFYKIFPQVVGSGGGVLAGGLTVAGGVMTVMTAGAALPVLVAVRPRITNRKVHAFKQKIVPSLLKLPRVPPWAWPAGSPGALQPSPRKSSTRNR